MSAPYFEVDWRWFAIAAFAICMASQYVRYFFARQELSRLRGAQPALAFGDVFCVRKEYIYPLGGVDDVSVWRVPIVNLGGDAENVHVTVAFNPGLPPMPGVQPRITLHRARDTASIPPAGMG